MTKPSFSGQVAAAKRNWTSRDGLPGLLDAVYDLVM